MIVRQTNTMTVPAENNGYFDSKVLSWQHLRYERRLGRYVGILSSIWYVLRGFGRSSLKTSRVPTGAFINGERLSPEGLLSEPYELKSDDIVEFAIDIVGEDNKTIK
jgi:pSer/pThr/pTyr-binding forkhead associated (FHA) protein